MGRYRTLKGGGWGSESDSLRVACRGFLDPGDRSGHVGFRVMRRNILVSRVLRSGGWYCGPGILRVADRIYYDPGRRNGYVGFRVMRRTR